MAMETVQEDIAKGNENHRFCSHCVYPFCMVCACVGIVPTFFCVSIIALVGKIDTILNVSLALPKTPASAPYVFEFILFHFRVSLFV